MAGDICALIVALALCALWLMYLWHRQRPPQPGHAGVQAMVQRLLTPRTPNDCPACRRQRILPPTGTSTATTGSTLVRTQEPAWGAQAHRH